MEEIWKLIPGYEPYQASNFGRLSGTRVKLMKPSKCFVNGKLAKLYISCFVRGVRYNESVHKLVMLTFVGEPPNDGKVYEIHHIDEDVTNNAVTNLEYITRKDHKRTHYLQRKYGHLII